MSDAANERELLRGMAEMFEEFKPFPTDKVNKQIDKKKSVDRNDDENPEIQAHAMQAVKNYRTKSKDFSKSNQKFTGKDTEKTADVAINHIGKGLDARKKSDKAADDTYKIAAKGRAKVEAVPRKPAKKSLKKREKIADKTNAKIDKKREKISTNYNKYVDSYKKGNAMATVHVSKMRMNKDDEKKQVEANKKSSEDKSKAKSSLNRANLEGALKSKPKREKMKGPKMKGVIRKESAFTDFCDASTQPLYEKEGEVPKCPPGYKYDVEMKMCVPKTNKDSIGKDQKYGNKDMKPGNGAGYNVWGNSGYSGAGFAWEEGPTDNDRAGGQE